MPNNTVIQPVAIQQPVSTMAPAPVQTALPPTAPAATNPYAGFPSTPTSPGQKIGLLFNRLRSEGQSADLLNDLPQQTSEDILEEMEPAERQEVSELLEYKENSAAGRMTTDYLALPFTATVADAIDKLREFEGAPETISTIFLIHPDETLAGAVPLVSLVLAPGGTALSTLAPERTISCEIDAKDKDVAEMFDKYNLLTLPVVNEQGQLAGIITADDVISLLRDKG